MVFIAQATNFPPAIRITGRESHEYSPPQMEYSLAVSSSVAGSMSAWFVPPMRLMLKLSLIHI